MFDLVEILQISTILLISP